MAEVYAQENILITDAVKPTKLNRGVWWYLGFENDGIYAEITIESGGPLLFRVDGGDPYSSHCQYGLQYVSKALEGDVIKLENWIEISGFMAIKEIDNCLISVLYYKS